MNSYLHKLNDEDDSGLVLPDFCCPVVCWVVCSINEAFNRATSSSTSSRSESDSELELLLDPPDSAFILESFGFAETWTNDRIFVRENIRCKYHRFVDLTHSRPEAVVKSATLSPLVRIEPAALQFQCSTLISSICNSCMKMMALYSKVYIVWILDQHYGGISIKWL